MKLDQDDFSLFGLPRRFQLDAAALSARWRELQSRVHPDRFVAEGAAAQRLAMQWAVRVNEAHQRLKDPLARATYLCELGGHKVQGRDGEAVSPEVLGRQMQWHEALAEAPSAAAVQALDAEVEARLMSVRDAVSSDLDVHHDVRAALAKVREWMFLARLREQIEQRLEILES
ncbi:MAG TPA: Fe-S protein assembly co-chaperone HscB [Burkholderiaceae bacterium]